MANSALIDQINDIKLEDEADVVADEDAEQQELPAAVVVMDE